MRKKNRGRGRMISGFVTYEGFIRDDILGNSWKIISIGKAHDGYWTFEQMRKQLEETIPLLQKQYPPDRYEILIMFDQSQNHKCFAPDALCAEELCAKDNGKNMKPQRDGWFMNAQGVRMVQKMTNTAGKPLGARSILAERGVDVKGMKLADMRKRLAEFEDFKQQRRWLEEICDKFGILCDFYPKFHCELNFIERVWSWIARFIKDRCDFTWNGLVKNMDAAIVAFPSTIAMAYQQSALRMFDAYLPRSNSKLSDTLAAYVNKKFSSHRRIPQSIFTAMDALGANATEQEQKAAVDALKIASEVPAVAAV
jgi:hypothetical protein